MSSPSPETIQTLIELRLVRDKATDAYTEACSSYNYALLSNVDYYRFITAKGKGHHPPNWLSEVDKKLYLHYCIQKGVVPVGYGEKAPRPTTARSQVLARMKKMEARLEGEEWEQSEEPKGTEEAKGSTPSAMTVEDILR